MNPTRRVDPDFVELSLDSNAAIAAASARAAAASFSSSAPFPQRPPRESLDGCLMLIEDLRLDAREVVRHVTGSLPF